MKCPCCNNEMKYLDIGARSSDDFKKIFVCVDKDQFCHELMVQYNILNGDLIWITPNGTITTINSKVYSELTKDKKIRRVLSADEYVKWLESNKLDISEHELWIKWGDKEPVLFCTSYGHDFYTAFMNAAKNNKTTENKTYVFNEGFITISNVETGETRSVYESLEQLEACI